MKGSRPKKPFGTLTAKFKGSGPVEQKLIIQTTAAAVLLPLMLFMAVSVFFHTERGALYFVGMMLGFCAIVAACADIYRGLGVLLSLIGGMFGGVVLFVLYAYGFQGKAPSTRGLIYIALYVLGAIVLGYLTSLATKKTAGRLQGIEMKRAVRIILMGDAVIACTAMLIMVYVAILAKVL